MQQLEALAITAVAGRLKLFPWQGDQLVKKLDLFVAGAVVAAGLLAQLVANHRAARAVLWLDQNGHAILLWSYQAVRVVGTVEDDAISTVDTVPDLLLSADKSEGSNVAKECGL